MVFDQLRPYDPDPDAIRDLVDAYWGPEGWRAPPRLADRATAIAAGLMFPADTATVELDHDGTVAAVRSAAAQLTAAEVEAAFVASLTSRRLDLRSGLGSFAVARHVPEHPFQPTADGVWCRVCGLAEGPGKLDLNVFSFERFKWGGVHHDGLDYVAFDLAALLQAPRLAPTTRDIATGRTLLDTLRKLPPGTTARQAVPALTMVPGNPEERRILLALLGFCGVLQTDEHPGHAGGFVAFSDRAAPPTRTDDPYPLCWWRARDGVWSNNLVQCLPLLA